MDKSKIDYNSKGRIHKFGRSFGDIAPAVVHKLDYAPDEMYIGIICQGLKFIFDVSSGRFLSALSKLKTCLGRYPTREEAQDHPRSIRKHT